MKTWDQDVFWVSKRALPSHANIITGAQVPYKISLEKSAQLLVPNVLLIEEEEKKIFF